MVSLQMQVNLYISGRKLKDLDAFSKSDPVCLVFEKVNGKWTKIGRTEQVKNSLNPDFQTSFEVPYFFEKVQNYKFVMIDGDGDGDYDTIGEVETTMGKLMGALKQTWTADLLKSGQSNRGKIIVRSQAVATSNEVAKMAVRIQGANNLAGGCMGMCPERVHYVCSIQKEVPGAGNFVTAVQWPGQFNTADVNLTEQVFPLAQLCNANKSSRIKFVLQDRD